MTEPAPVVTVDGPSGSGKGTVSRILADRLGWHFLDSGALYRLVGLAAWRRGLTIDDEQVVAALARGLDATFRTGADGEPGAYLDGEPVAEALRSETAGELASRVAAMPAVRQALLERQRAFRRPPGLVADGRDMGTVVFPDAPLKFFLTASLEERARRRHKQLKEQGASATLTDLLSELAQRDERDAGRAAAPLRAADDAVVVDSTTMTIEGVVGLLLTLVRGRLDEARAEHGRGDIQ